MLCRLKHIQQSFVFLAITVLFAASAQAQSPLYSLGISSSGQVHLQSHDRGNLAQTTVIRQYPEFNKLTDVKPLQLSTSAGEMIAFIATTSREREEEIVIVRTDSGAIHRRFPIPDGAPVVLKTTYAPRYFGEAIEVLSDVSRPGFLGNSLTWTVYNIASGAQTRLQAIDIANDMVDYALNDEGHFTIYAEKGTFGVQALRFGPFFESNQSVIFLLSPTGRFEGLASSGILGSRGHSVSVVSEPSAGIGRHIVALNHNLPASISIVLAIPLTSSMASPAKATGGLYGGGTTYCLHGESSLAQAQTTLACYNLLTGQHNEAQFPAETVQLIASGAM